MFIIQNIPSFITSSEHFIALGYPEVFLRRLSLDGEWQRSHSVDALLWDSLITLIASLIIAGVYWVVKKARGKEFVR